MNFEPWFLRTDERPHKHGWWGGGYCALCKHCGEQFIGAKGAWHCADCAYDFDEQLEYERLWSNVGWQYALVYTYKKLGLYNEEL